MKITSKIFSLILILSILASFQVVPAIADTTGGVAFEFSTETAITGLKYGATDRKLYVDTENANSYGVTSLLKIEGTQVQAQFYLTEQAVAAFNNSNYDYINILIRNAQSTAQEMVIYVSYNAKGKAVVEPGWSVVSLPKEYMASAGFNYSTANAIRFMPSSPSLGDCYNIDKIWLTNGKVTSTNLELTNIIPADDFNDMSILDASVGFEFNQDVLVKESAGVFADENGNSVEANLFANGKMVIAKAKSILSPGTTYTLTIPSATIRSSLGIPYLQSLTMNFETSDSSLMVGNIKAADSSGGALMTVPQDGKVMLSADVLNTGTEKAYAAIAATLVSEDSGIAQTTISVAQEIPAQMTEASSLVPLEVEVPEDSYLVAVVVDSAADLNPLSQNYFALTSDAHSSGVMLSGGVMGEDVSVTLNESSLNVDTLTISGTVSGNTGGLVIAAVREKESRELQLAIPVVCDADGHFTCDYVFDGTNSGWYETRAIAKGADIAASSQIYYLGDTTKEEIRAFFDSDTINEDATYAIVQKWRDGMGIPSVYDDAIIAHISSVLCEQKPYETYIDLIDIMNLSVTALNKLNDASWSTYANVIDKYDMILNDDGSLDDFKKYDANGKAEIYKIAVKSSPFVSFGDFRDAITNATKTYAQKLKKEKEQNRRPSFGGGGGGGSVSVGSSSVSQLIQEAEKPIVDNASGKAEFTDFSSDHWAYEAVNELSARNIIVGYEDGSFCPNKAVTRAEFVKMLTGAFAFSEGKGEKFDDVANDAWYKDFLDRASSAGIVKGANGKFSPDSSITRQDAALMLYRSLIYKNALVDGTFDFNDSESISDYAASAVEALASSQLISGYTDGNFAPKNEITRAETAKLVYAAICYITGGGVK